MAGRPVRFHASHPVHGPCGCVVGELELIDDRQRRFTDSDHRLLGDLAALAALELRAADTALATKAPSDEAAGRQPTAPAAGLGASVRREHDLEYLALHDPLTGLANRRLLMDRIDVALAGLRRERGTVGVLFLDLDGFKRINDTWGHEAGDHVIIEAASRLAAIVRETDIAARLGGDEFVLVFDQLDDARAAMSVVERLHERVRQRPSGLARSRSNSP